MGSPMEMFFALGDKVTKGDPERKLDYDYYLMWIIAIAFIVMLVGAAWDFIQYQKWNSVVWILIAVAMLWFQYWNLKQYYLMRKSFNANYNKPVELKIESSEEMLKAFQK